jgi:cysteinyl-tRNA synthetase
MVMKLFLYNTLTRKKEGFHPIDKVGNEVRMYTCGPTVYWNAHIGNMRSYIFPDVLKRVLLYSGLKVNQVINVTDVGHLTSDADSGDDKVEVAARREGKFVSEITKHYFSSFKRDFEALGLLPPSKWAWATDHIQEQIDLVKSLEEKGFTYKTDDGVYFDTEKFGGYGRLSNKNVESLEAGKRVSMGGKKNKADFALWKFSSEGESRQQEWDSPWGKGFPGWHIECSAMAIKHLGEHFDIHTGGEDHMHIHHENEIAQSEAFTGSSPWVNFWMHGAFLISHKGKVSKSTGGLKTVSELEADGISPLAYKYFCYTAHYRKPLTWSGDAIASAVTSYRRLREHTSSLVDDGLLNDGYLERFGERIADDLDMPGALAVLWELVRDKGAKGKFGTIKKMDEVFALGLLVREEVEVPELVLSLAHDREVARKGGDWEKSDVLREKIRDEGFLIRDEKDGFFLEKA